MGVINFWILARRLGQPFRSVIFSTIDRKRQHHYVLENVIVLLLLYCLNLVVSSFPIM